MGLYRDMVLPRLVDLTCGQPALHPWRARATEGLSGRVVEIGFGSGRNVPHYPVDVEAVLAVEPAALARRLSVPRVTRSHVRVEYVGLDGEEIPLGDDTCDNALCTFTLCTVPDPARGAWRTAPRPTPGRCPPLPRARRVTRSAVARWQRRLDPWQRRVADGCHLTRDPVALVQEAGFVLRHADQRYARGPKPWSYFTLGVGENPAHGHANDATA